MNLVYMSLSVYAELSNITKDAKYIDDAYRAYLKAQDIMWDEDEVFSTGTQDSYMIKTSITR